MLTKQTLANVSVGYVQQPTEADRGDFEDRQGNATSDDLAIPEVDLQLKSQAIVAKTRKLKAVWTPELAQDLNAYHSVDAEAELTSMLSEYISMEIDLEILDMLISDAQTTAYWSATPGEDYDGSGTGESNWNITTFYGTRFEWFQTLVQKITTVSNEIHKLTLRGGANFVVVSPKVATILESLPGYNSTPGADASVTHTTTYGSGVASGTTHSSTAAQTGSSVKVDKGIYFIRGQFVQCNEQTLPLSVNSIGESARVGFTVTEELITPEADATLTDNARGSANYAAKGAHRLKITLTLSKLSLDSTEDTEFVQLMRIKKN